jgi:uracil-DNA glycosylase family 4
LTRRRSSYRSFASLQRDNRVCRACAEAGYPIESLPVFEGHEGQRAYMLGQAPGVVEGEERRPWRGRAGQTLRRWLRLEEDVFYATFCCASVTRCYPGRAPGGGGDRTPAAREQELCTFWRDWELRLLRPALIVPVGGLAIRRLLGLASLDALDRRVLPVRRRDRGPASSPVRSQPLAQLSRESGTARARDRARPSRARNDRRPLGKV